MTTAKIVSALVALTPGSGAAFSPLGLAGGDLHVSADKLVLAAMASYCDGYWHMGADQHLPFDIYVANDDGQIEKLLQGSAAASINIDDTFLQHVQIDIAPDLVGHARFKGSHLFDLTVRGKEETTIVVGQNGPHACLAGVRALRNISAVQWSSEGGVFLHAAGVAVEGSGVLILGDRKSGKTSQVCQMLQRGGAQFVSNDRVYLFPDGHIVGIPVSVNLRPPTMNRYPELVSLQNCKANPHNVSASRPAEDVSIGPSEFTARFGAAITSRVPLRHVLRLTYRPEAEGVSCSPLAFDELARELVAAQLEVIDASQPFWTYAPKDFGAIREVATVDIRGWAVKSGADTIDLTTDTILDLIRQRGGVNAVCN